MCRVHFLERKLFSHILQGQRKPRIYPPFSMTQIVSQRGHQQTTRGEASVPVSTSGMKLWDCHHSDPGSFWDRWGGKVCLIGLCVSLSPTLSWFWALLGFVSWRALCSGASLKSASLSVWSGAAETHKPGQLLSAVSSRVHPSHSARCWKVSLPQVDLPARRCPVSPSPANVTWQGCFTQWFHHCCFLLSENVTQSSSPNWGLIMELSAGSIQTVRYCESHFWHSVHTSLLPTGQLCRLCQKHGSERPPGSGSPTAAAPLLFPHLPLLPWLLSARGLLSTQALSPTRGATAPPSITSLLLLNGAPPSTNRS